MYYKLVSIFWTILREIKIFCSRTSKKYQWAPLMRFFWGLEQGKYSQDKHYPHNFSVMWMFPGKRTKDLGI